MDLTKGSKQVNPLLTQGSLHAYDLERSDRLVNKNLQ